MAAKNKFYGIWLLILGVFILAGLFSVFKLWTVGHSILNANDMLVWTLPITTYVFLALMSSGLTQLASFPAVFGITPYQKLSRRFSFLGLATLVAAFLALSMELGSVFKMIFFITSPNPNSPIWWMGAIYFVELVFIAGKLIKKPTQTESRTLLDILASGVAILAPLMLGAVFSMTESRPVFFGLFLPVFFLVISFLSAIAIAIFHKNLFIYLGDEEEDSEQMQLIARFESVFEFALGISVVLYGMRFVFKSTTYIESFATGAVMIPFFILLVAFALMVIPNIRNSKNGRLISSILSLIGIFGCHLELIFDGQAKTIGVREGQILDFTTYWPNRWEWFIFLFSLGVMFGLYTLGEKYLDLKNT